MTPDERAALEAELAVVRRKHSKRRNMPGYAANVAELEARAAEISAWLTAQT